MTFRGFNPAIGRDLDPPFHEATDAEIDRSMQLADAASDAYAKKSPAERAKFLTAIGNTKWYGYAAGEYGGGSWTGRRQLEDDRFDYNDIRAIGRTNDCQTVNIRCCG